MSSMTAPSRLERLLADDSRDCCDGDPQDRLDELETTYEAATSDRVVATATFDALADETRYGIVSLLVTAEEELCVCEIAPLFPVSDSAISHALTRLTGAGIVDRRKDGRWRYYRASERAETLIEAVAEIEGES
jgi:DNA-binding transcriptional ArsR family regulator